MQNLSELSISPSVGEEAGAMQHGAIETKCGTTGYALLPDFYATVLQDLSNGLHSVQTAACTACSIAFEIHSDTLSRDDFILFLQRTREPSALRGGPRPRAEAHS